MKVEIKIPSFGESVVQATVGSVLKPSGSFVEVDEEILELETDKLNQVLHASHAGQLQWIVKAGDEVSVGQTIGTIDTTLKEESASPKPSQKSIVPEKKEVTPKKIQEHSPKISRDSSRETRKKMTKLRKVIAERLVQVKNQTAMLTTFNEVDLSKVIDIREKNQELFQKKYGVKLGFMSFFIKSVVSALQEFPGINARIEEDEIVYNHYFDISVAVSTDQGLMVPVIRAAESLSFADIEKSLKTLAEKARTGTIALDDLQGGTFTITNAGIFGSLLSTPILNPPQSAILGMHNIVKRAVVVNDEIVIRPMMYLALSYDHRIVDGKEAVSFLVRIKRLLEEATNHVLEL